MTVTNAERVSLSSPAALCCAVPYLLGFHPTSSAVLVWMRDSCIALTERVDLPEPTEDISAWASMVGHHPMAEAAENVVAILFPGVADGRGRDRMRALAVALAGQRWAGDLEVLWFRGDRWTGLLCDDPECCPPEGEPIDPELRTRVAAEFTHAGFAPLPTRDEIIASLASDPDVVDGVLGTRLLEGDRGIGRRGMRLDRWRESMITALVEWMRAPRAQERPERLAHMLLGLRDVRVRDTVLWEMAWGRDCSDRGAAEAMSQLMRAAPDGDVRAVATVAAIAHWLSGDGARAGMAVDRALEDDPDYSLARIVDSALRSGLPPSFWRDAMGDLGRKACRDGVLP